MNIEYEDNSDFAEFNTPRIYLEENKYSEIKEMINLVVH